MPILQVTLTFDGTNVSAQVGDIAYYSINTMTQGGFDTSKRVDTKKLGEIVSILDNTITVRYDNTIVNFPPNSGEIPFISFVKNKKANTTSLLGYYAEVKFINNSHEKAELFSVGSEVVESSK